MINLFVTQLNDNIGVNINYRGWSVAFTNLTLNEFVENSTFTLKHIITIGENIDRDIDVKGKKELTDTLKGLGTLKIEGEDELNPTTIFLYKSL